LSAQIRTLTPNSNHFARSNTLREEREETEEIRSAQGRKDFAGENLKNFDGGGS